MKSLKALALLAVLFLVTVSRAEPFLVATWNIRCVDVKDSLRGDAWSKRAPEIAKVVRFRNFDVVGMQEVDSTQRTMLENLLPEYEWVLDRSTEGNPIAFRKDRLELLDNGVFWYSRSMVPGVKDWDSKHPRYCNWARLVDKETRKELFVFNTHWDNKGDTARMESARMARNLVPRIAGDAPTIFMGDLNIKPGRKPIQILKEDSLFREALETSPVVSIPEGSFTKFRTDRHSEETLDHMFCRGGVDILRYGILRETYFDGENYRFPSDHHPVMIEIEVR
ncbi:endonuclease/exonuclease/phosphatase family protein [Fibrobacter sp. UBA3629]|uniref:endonuclease/exonuclease/phosphatase family protein n=1 Tax=Fibrobacter sp. UBA3629 TaxID=1946530 RepID=UPI0025C603E5|nr:endonuclease/exonuclease/phosphatase family protein [Fibrobacter sp. UBA3629]